MLPRWGRGVLAAAEHFQTADRNRRDECFLCIRRARGFLQVVEIAAQRLLAGILYWSNARRPHDPAHGLGGFSVELREFVLLERPHDDAHRLACADAIGRHRVARRRPETARVGRKCRRPRLRDRRRSASACRTRHRWARQHRRRPAHGQRPPRKVRSSTSNSFSCAGPVAGLAQARHSRSGRGRLPAWVVVIRSVLRIMAGVLPVCSKILHCAAGLSHMALRRHCVAPG